MKEHHLSKHIKRGHGEEKECLENRDGFSIVVKAPVYMGQANNVEKAWRSVPSCSSRKLTFQLTPYQIFSLKNGTGFIRPALDFSRPSIKES